MDDRNLRAPYAVSEKMSKGKFTTVSGVLLGLIIVLLVILFRFGFSLIFYYVRVIVAFFVSAQQHLIRRGHAVWNISKKVRFRHMFLSDDRVECECREACGAAHSIETGTYTLS